MNLLINALQFESDSHNSQMLLGIMWIFYFLIVCIFNFFFICIFDFLGGLLLCVQDSAIFEERENDAGSDITAQSDTTSNLLSSGNCNYYRKYKYLNFKILHTFCT